MLPWPSKHRHLPRVEKNGCTYTHTHARTHNTTQSEHLYYTCIHVHVHTCTCTHVQQSSCITVMSSGRGIGAGLFVDSSLFSSSSSAPVLTEAVPLSADISCFRPTTTTTYTHIGTSSLGIKSHGSHVTYIHVAKLQVPLAHACLFNTHHICTQASIHTRTSRSHYIPLPPSSLS